MEQTFLLLPPLSLSNQKISLRFFTTSSIISLLLLLLLVLLRLSTRTPFRLRYYIRRRHPPPKCCLHRRIGAGSLDRQFFPTPTAELGADSLRLDHLPWLNPPPALTSQITGPIALRVWRRVLGTLSVLLLLWILRRSRFPGREECFPWRIAWTTLVVIAR